MESSAVPKVSVIIPLYNKAPYIKRALDSVFAQTVQDFEIVVVGGNSTDGGEDIVLGYSDPRIRFVKEAGKGVSAARNQGVDAARAELVAFLDADDEWLPEFLETILRLREKWPDAGIYATSRYIEKPQQKGCLIRVIPKDFPDKWDGIVSPIFLYVAKHGFPGVTSSTCIPKEIFHKVGGFVTGISRGEDNDLFGRISLTSPYVFSTESLVIYHSDDTNSLMTQPSLGQLVEHPFQTSVKSIYGISNINDLKLDKYLRLYLESLYFIIVDNNIAVGDYTNAKKVLHLINSKFFFRKRYLLKLFKLYLPEKLYVFGYYAWKILHQ